MPLSQTIMGGLSVAVSLTGSGLYLRSIFQKHTRPHIFTWLVWGIGSGIIFVVQIVKHADAGSWSTGCTAVFCFLVAVLAVRCGEKNITLSDKISFALSLLSIPVWFITQDPIYSVILIVLTEALGFYPTFRKSYAKPWDENVASYLLSIAQYGLSLSAMAVFSPAAVLYPLAVLLTNGSFVMFLFLRRHQLSRQQT